MIATDREIKELQDQAVRDLAKEYGVEVEE